MLAEERHHLRVVEIVVLEERNGGFQRFHRLFLMFDDGLLLRCFLRHRHIFAHHCIGAQVEHNAHNEPYRHLAHNFVFAFQSFFVAAENLDVVVEKSQKSQPQGGDNHQDEVNVAHAAQQQHGHQYGNDDDDAAHRRYAFFLGAEGIDGGVACRLGYFLPLHKLDEVLAKPC